MTVATFAFFIIHGGLLLTLCWHDLRYGLLPDKFTCPLLWSGLLYYLCLSPANLVHAVWGAIGGYLAFGLIYWLYREYAGGKASATAILNFSPRLGHGMGGKFYRSWFSSQLFWPARP
ncbi:Leader peptidase (Prepilin peptidase) [Klebsiella grimontii]|uniref:Leader peptidase (Prepilin peptidase) n=1 Tax=Klebsiella grimontii TaxID=2058152 RepID=A0A7H4NVJ2_9ENTR|nr:Leader peptidase (Prepilin peptidase) [Klebsiella grimontii]